MKTPEIFDFGIVIPLLQWSNYLPYCIQSCLFQEGNHSLHIVVVDKSGDDSVAKLCKAMADVSPSPELIKITYLKSYDSGAPEAINHGMTLLESRMMTWLGSDDMLFPGSLSTIGNFLKFTPSCEWVTGRSLMINDAGVLVPPKIENDVVRAATGFPREAVSLGLHASHRSLPFIQQEGTFWAKSLWEKSGGAVDENLRLAFDFELWTRMAHFAAPTQLNVPLGIFRQRANQLSSDRAGYLREVEAVRSKNKLSQETVRFPFTARGAVAICDSPGNWRTRWVGFRFYSMEKASSPKGGFILEEKLLSLLMRLVRTNRGVRFVSTILRRKQFVDPAKKSPHQS